MRCARCGTWKNEIFESFSLLIGKSIAQSISPICPTCGWIGKKNKAVSSQELESFVDSVYTSQKEKENECR